MVEVKKSLRPKPRPKGLGLSSTRPRSRPLSDEEGIAKQEAAAVKQAQSLDQVRKFGNLEFRADMDEQLRWNPLARLGFEPDQSVVGRPTYNFQEGRHSPDIHEGMRYPYTASQEYIDDTLPEAAPGAYYRDIVGRVKPGSVVVNSNTAKSPVWSHEYTHGGLEKVIEYLNEDKEFFKNKYGEDTVKLLEKIELNEVEDGNPFEKGPNEKLTEMLDDVSKDAEVDLEGNLIPAAGTGLGTMENTRTAVSDHEASTDRVQLRRNLEKGRVNDADMSTRLFFEQNLPGYAGIFKAAEDMLEKQGEPLPSEKRGWWEQKANKWLSGKGLFNKGGLAEQTEEALGWTAESKKFAEANPVDIKAPEGLSIKNVPAFKRPMSAGPSDEWTGRQDELGNREYKSKIDGSTYFIKPDADQRTELEKIQQDIIPAVKKYLANPTAPSKEQTIEFLKTAAGDAWETISIPGDLVSGDKTLGDITLGDVFEVAGSAAVASLPMSVPEGSMRIFGGIGMEGTSTSKNFKKAKSLLEGSNLNTESLKGGAIDFNLNQKIWEETNWYVDPSDGQWRFHLDDSKSELKPFKEVFKIDSETGLTFKEMTEQTIPKENSKNVLLESFFNHKDLYSKYPELKKLNVKFFSDPTVKALGSADAEGKSISFNLSKYKNYEDLKNVVLHEIQHIVQKKENFVPGSNSKSIPPELVQKKDTEILQKAKPFEDLKDELENKSNVLERRLVEEIEKQKDNPLTGITREQELEIRKLKYYDPETLEYTGPSWTSIAKDYGVKPGQIQKAWGRVNLLDNLREENKKLNWEVTKIESKLYEMANERTKIEHEFYEGAGGEIESRLVQYMEDGTKKFPLEAKTEMLNKEGDKFQYRGKDGVDPFVYKNKPRRNPEDSLFLDRLKGKVKRFLDISPRFEEEITPKFAQGGVVNDMNRQMKMFAVGGLNDDGVQNDPVSGNEIPPGSLAKEVRDDIPAQLSEGEYVVPADVVRFFGVKHFEDLRNKAKGGLNQMDKDGRIGGEPVAQNKPLELPFGDEELQVRQPAAAPQAKMAGVSMNTVKPRIGMAKGGYVGTSMEAVRMRSGGVVKGYNGGGSVIPSETPRGASTSFANRPNLFQGYGGASGGGALEVRTYVNAAGDTILIPFLNGKIFNGLVIPDGFYLEGSPEATFADGDTQKVTQDAGGEVDSGDTVSLDTPTVTVKGVTAPEDLDRSDSFFGVNQDFFALSPEDLGTYGEDFGSSGDMLRYAGIASLVVPGLAAVGVIAGIGRQVTHANDIANIRAAAQVATMRGYTDQAIILNARADKMVKGGGFLAKAMDKAGGLSGESIADKVIKSYTTIYDYGSKGDSEGLTRGMFNTDDAWNGALQMNAPRGYTWVSGDDEETGSYQIDPDAGTVSIPTSDGGTIEISVGGPRDIATADGGTMTGITKINSLDDPFHVFSVTPDSNVVRPQRRPAEFKTPTTTTPITTTPITTTPITTNSGNDGSDDFHKEMMAAAQPNRNDRPQARPKYVSKGGGGGK